MYMFSSIESVKSNNIYRIAPINLFENRNKRFDNNSELFKQLTNNSFNLNHPKIQGNGVQANHLDFMA